MSSTPDCPHPSMSQMPSCQVVSNALSDYLEDVLSDGDRLKLEDHFAACPLCLVYLDQFRTIYHITGEVPSEQLPHDFNEVMGKAIRLWKAELEDQD